MDEEWALVEPLIPPARRGGNRRHVVVREVVNGLMYVLSTGCQWRAIPKDLPPRSTLYDYFDLWSWDGTLNRQSERYAREGIDLSLSTLPGTSRRALRGCARACRPNSKGRSNRRGSSAAAGPSGWRAIGSRC